MADYSVNMDSQAQSFLAAEPDFNQLFSSFSEEYNLLSLPVFPS